MSSNTGVSARAEPGGIETFLAGNVRNLAIGRRARALQNPIERSSDIIAAGRAHFADHCASCHANDGRGDTAMGQGLFPKPPDMRLARTQDLTDGELFYIIENGIRFTGMPGWGTGEESGESASWHLVHFIRHLPDLVSRSSKKCSCSTLHRLTRSGSGWRRNGSYRVTIYLRSPSRIPRRHINIQENRP